MLILCGPGNNGGDGGVVARHLDAWGFPVRVRLVRPVRPAPRRCRRAVGDPRSVRHGESAWFDDHPAEEVDREAIHALLAGAEWLVNGLLGTGLSRPVEGPLRTVIEAINEAGKPVFALDLPSGLDADSGQPLGVAVRAEATATFVAPKLGFSAPGAADYTGEVAVIDIGLPRRLLEPYFLSSVRGPLSVVRCRVATAPRARLVSPLRPPLVITRPSADARDRSEGVTRTARLQQRRLARIGGAAAVAREARVMSDFVPGTGVDSPSGDPGVHPRRATTVLVVDDSAFDRRLVGQLLDPMPGVRVVYAADGREGLAAIAGRRPP